MPDEEAVKQGLEDDLKQYKKLKAISNSDEFKTYFEFLLKTASEKMVWAFTTGKDGDNIKNWEDFCKVKGEITARLHPIQEVMGAQAMIDHLTNQLKQFYNQE